MMVSQTSSEKPTQPPNWTKFYAQLAIVALLFPILLFLAAGRLDWGMGWVFVALAAGSTVISRTLMIRRNPDLLAERTGALSREDTKPWDKIIVPIVEISPLIQVIVAGLDYRFGWSTPFVVWVELLGIALMLVGYGLTTWAMMTNAFFSSCVRLQTDREQAVIDQGPYRIMRHPGYLGLAVGAIGGSLVLGSWWSLIPAGLMALLLVVRTALEDKSLRAELPGYEAYARQVRYRLLPGVW
jgi:protein-S-isoprenylcysteine O-methyltransferase Ste14